MSKLVRAISENGGVIVTIIDSTEIVDQMEKYHKTSAVVTAALGRLITGAVLMSSTLKSDSDSITLQIEADGPIEKLVAVVNGKNEVKGYAKNKVAEIPPRADGKLDVGGAVGHNGDLTVVKDLGMKEPYCGQIPLTSGEIAEDITAYYAVSEQIPTVCALGVLVNPDLSVSRAGGYMLQLLPGATDEEIDQIEKNIGDMQSMTKMLSSGMTVYDIIDKVLEGFNPNVLDECDACYHCSCSLERCEGIYRTLSKEERKKIASEQEQVEIKCDFCDKVYYLNTKDYLD